MRPASISLAIFFSTSGFCKCLKGKASKSDYEAELMPTLTLVRPWGQTAFAEE
jgi:hypothetical protein